jgi:hypothetical protein
MTNLMSDSRTRASTIVCLLPAFRRIHTTPFPPFSFIPISTLHQPESQGALHLGAIRLAIESFTRPRSPLLSRPPISILSARVLSGAFKGPSFALTSTRLPVFRQLHALPHLPLFLLIFLHFDIARSPSLKGRPHRPWTRVRTRPSLPCARLSISRATAPPSPLVSFSPFRHCTSPDSRSHPLCACLHFDRLHTPRPPPLFFSFSILQQPESQKAPRRALYCARVRTLEAPPIKRLPSPALFFSPFRHCTQPESQWAPPKALDSRSHLPLFALCPPFILARHPTFCFVPPFRHCTQLES